LIGDEEKVPEFAERRNPNAGGREEFLLSNELGSNSPPKFCLNKTQKKSTLKKKKPISFFR
jgi:hypothetical protein